MRALRRRMISGGMAVALVLAIGVPTTPAAINACQAGKKRCVKSYLSRLLRCHSDAETSGAVLDPACIQRAEDKYTGGATPERGCFAKLEAQRPCSTIGDSEALWAKTGAFAFELVLALDPTYPVPVLNACSAGKKQCVSRLAAALLGAHAKAEKTGQLDQGRIQRAEDKFTGGATPEKGCFAKREAKGVCLTTGDTAAIHDAVDGLHRAERLVVAAGEPAPHAAVQTPGDTIQAREPYLGCGILENQELHVLAIPPVRGFQRQFQDVQ
jgi:hypothetical protein